MRNCLCLAAMALFGTIGPALAVDPMLERLAPDDRFVQACDLAVMLSLGNDADRAHIDALHRVSIRDHEASGDGGAFRRQGIWYEFSYHCRTTADHLEVLDLSTEVKRPIPETEWETYHLYN